MFKWTMNYDTGDYEYLDENGYSMDRGDFNFNFDRSPFEDDRHSGLMGGLFGGLFGDDDE